MHYLIYKITNNINGKIYIGAHQTLDINDDYMGSGVILKKAQRKYGIENFTKTILYKCFSKEDMFLKENEIVNKEFIDRSDTYNMKIGGEGGWDHIRICKKRNESISKAVKRQYETGDKISPWIEVTKSKSKETRIEHASAGGKVGGIRRGEIIRQKNDLEAPNKLLKIAHIDLTKFGWVGKVAKELNISHTEARRFITKYYKGEVYKRKNRM